MTKRLLVAAILGMALRCGEAKSAIIDLTLTGTVDVSGFTLGGVSPTLGSEFVVKIGIDDASSSSGIYPVRTVSYTLELGTYNTSNTWTGNLIATQSGSAVILASDPSFSISGQGEHFSLSISGFGPSQFDDPLTWTSPDVLRGDIVLRGLGGFNSLDQLSGGTTYSGTFALNVARASPVPSPAAGWLLFSGLAGCWKTRKWSTERDRRR